MTISDLEGSKARLEYQNMFSRDWKIKNFIFVYKSPIIHKINVLIKYYLKRFYAVWMDNFIIPYTSPLGPI